LVLGKLDAHRKAVKEWSKFKFASPAVGEIALRAVDSHTTALLEGEARAKAAGVLSRTLQKDAQLKRQELAADREGWRR
jgi:hypothetical protein